MYVCEQIKAVYPLILDITKRFSKYISLKLANNPREAFDARDISARYTADVVSSCVFAADGESFTSENPEIIKNGRALLESTIQLVFLYFITPALPFMKFLLNYFVVSKDVERFFGKLIYDAIKHREDNNFERNDFLGHLIALKNKKNIDKESMVAHAATFFIDGFETSSIAIGHILYQVF